MKLIREEIQNANFLVEEKGDKKNYFIEGVFMQSDLKNRNGRVYPRSVMETEVKRYTKENIDRKRAFGELGHPDGPTINLERVSHMITDLSMDGSNVMGKAKIMDTPYGKIVKNLMDEGATLGVSSRGMGSLKAGAKGAQEVQGDFYLATAADIVADPSAPDAFVSGIMENKEWIWDNGIIKEVNIERYKREIVNAKLNSLQEAKLQAFNNFLSKL
jgi:hypothetical protein|tara:strand:+ start:1556 stop:2203 length:648 start_codon:yes stop_codon:yes gene_type:complete